MGEPAKKAGKKKIVIEEVDSSKEAAPEPAKKAGKKKIAIEEVDSSKEAAPVEEPAKKAGKKKIVIEEVDSSKEAAPVPATPARVRPGAPVSEEEEDPVAAALSLKKQGNECYKRKE